MRFSALSTGAILALLAAPVASAFAQTSPAPFAFSAAAPAYRIDAWDAAAAAGTYPPNLVFHRFSNPAPTAQEPAAGDWTCGYNLRSRPRILGKDSLGLSFINTSSAQYDDCVSGANTLFAFAGKAVLALNTSNGVAPQTLSGLSVLTLGGGAIAVNAAVSASSGAVRLGYWRKA